MIKLSPTTLPNPNSGTDALTLRSGEQLKVMSGKKYDIIVIGCGSGGLSVGLFMNKAGLKVLMTAKSDKDIGGDCLNDGCVPSKAFIHVAGIAHKAKTAQALGLVLQGNVEIKKVTEYIYQRQEIIRKHENAEWLKNQGIEVALGATTFTGKDEIEVNGKRFRGKKIVIATGSKPKKLFIPGVEKVRYYDNESIFHLQELPKQLLVIGGGPISIEIAQAMSRLGSNVTVVHQGNSILENDDKVVTDILMNQLEKENIHFHLNAKTDHFISSTEALILSADKSTMVIPFDAVFVGIGRETNPFELDPEKADLKFRNGKIWINDRLQTTNKNIFVCGDVAGDLQFSHAAEFHARILLNNFFSPFKKKLNNEFMSWVTFTDPELATFGLNEKQLKEKQIPYERLEQDFNEDDRAVTDNYQYGKLILLITKKSFLKKQKILGGSMVAPKAGELIQELILANNSGISIDALFDKIYPYPTASRVNQYIIVKYKEKTLTGLAKKLLHQAYKIFS